MNSHSGCGSCHHALPLVPRKMTSRKSVVQSQNNFKVQKQDTTNYLSRFMGSTQSLLHSRRHDMCFILLRFFTWIFRNTGYFQANQAQLVVALYRTTITLPYYLTQLTIRHSRKTHLSTCHSNLNIITQTHQGTLQSTSQKVLNGFAPNHTPLIIRHTRNTTLAQPLNRPCQQLTVPSFLDLPN